MHNAHGIWSRCLSRINASVVCSFGKFFLMVHLYLLRLEDFLIISVSLGRPEAACETERETCSEEKNKFELSIFNQDSVKVHAQGVSHSSRNKKRCIIQMAKDIEMIERLCPKHKEIQSSTGILWPQVSERSVAVQKLVEIRMFCVCLTFSAADAAASSFRGVLKLQILLCSV